MKAKQVVTGLRRATVRTRVLGYIIALAAVALTAAGLVAYLLERSAIDRSISEDLRLRTELFLTLASSDNPATGEPYANAEDLMRAGIAQVVAGPHESAIGHVDGVARFVPGGGEHLELEEDEEFLAAATASSSTRITVQSVRTDEADYRYVSVPLLEPDGDVLATFTIATDRGALLGDLNRTFALYALSGGVTLVLIGLVAWVTVGRLLQPIRLLDQTARDISDSDLSRRIDVSGDDDLARLSRTVNAMLDRLESAFVTQRQLLDDAGHELRTPLAVIRTNLELLEPRDPDHVSDTQRRLLDEVAMMSRLVDDLVVLAKADRPEFVQHERVDLDDLARGVFARAEGLADREWSLEAHADGVISGDPQRLTQAWMQLVSNAVKFSADGSAITIGADTSGSDVRLWVRDVGRGIPASHLATVLDRFQRVDDSVEGAGLGLPIVAAIATAHGGRVDIDSTEGVGTVVTIVLPRTEAS